LKEISKVYEVVFPDFGSNLKFKFLCSTDDGNFNFEFQYFNNQWNCWITLPDGSIRLIGVYADITNWIGYTDYSAYIRSVNPIVFGNLKDVNIYIIKWL